MWTIEVRRWQKRRSHRISAVQAVIAQVSWLAPARWAYPALASSVDLKAEAPWQCCPPGALRLDPGEVGYGESVAGYARFYGMDVTYRQNSSFWFGSAAFVAAGLAADAIGNASARNRAQRMAASQWRDHAHVRTMLTNRRLLCDYQNQWLNFWHEGIIEFAFDAPSWSLVLRYQSGSPLMLHGPAVPWFAVAVAHIVYGPHGMRLPGIRAAGPGDGISPPGHRRRDRRPSRQWRPESVAPEPNLLSEVGGVRWASTSWRT